MQANEQLSFAFEHCHRSHVRNQRRILKYLIPVKLTLGSLPSLELVRRHGLTEVGRSRGFVHSSRGDAFFSETASEMHSSKGDVFLSEIASEFWRIILRACPASHQSE
jgi:hypothetical protein